MEPPEEAGGFFGHWGKEGRKHAFLRIPCVFRAGWQVFVDRSCIEFRHQVHATALCGQFGYVGLWIREVSEMTCTGGAGAHAGRGSVDLWQVLVIDPVNAEGAFLHDPFGLIKFARAIGAGPGAKAAPDAVLFIDQHDAIFDTLVAGAGRA